METCDKCHQEYNIMFDVENLEGEFERHCTECVEIDYMNGNIVTEGETINIASKRKLILKQKLNE